MPPTSNISSLEHALTYHVRSYLTKNYDKDTIKVSSFVFSLITCLFDASVVTFSIFSPQFLSVLHYNQLKINIIGACMLMGLYLPLPVLGYLSDAHGPVLLALIGFILCPGYLLGAFTFHYELGYPTMAAAFFMIGCGTSSAYFCSLLTCAKIYPDRKGLSISLPVSCYGLSSLILSSLFKLGFFKVKGTRDLNVQKVFIFLGSMYLVTGLLNWCSSVVVTIEKEILFDKNVSEVDAESPVLTATTTGAETSSLSEETPLMSSEFLEPQDHEAKFKRFLQDPSMKWMYLALFLLGGPLEVFVTNLGSLTQTVGDVTNADISTQVTLFSLFSTLTRLAMSVVSDVFKGPKTTMTMLLSSTVVCALAFALVAFDINDFRIVSSLVGVGYGIVFTLFPTLIATIWGVEILGSTWGLFLSAPAIGSLVYGLLYAFEYDRSCQIRPDQFFATNCLTYPFSAISAGFLISGAVLFMCWRLSWFRLAI